MEKPETAAVSSLSAVVSPIAALGQTTYFLSLNLLGNTVSRVFKRLDSDLVMSNRLQEERR
jgi:hypothetical protein